MDGSYSWCADGTGVRIYIIDTGVLDSHSEFATNRVDTLPELQSYFQSFGPSYELGYQCWTSSVDNFSMNAMHGTGVASVAGGVKFGVAKGATIVDARALPCSGVPDVWHITKTVDWICRLDPRRVAGMSVINMSFEFLYSQTNPDYQAMNATINAAVDTYNIPVVSAAGNDSGNIFWYSPANAARSITVGGLSSASDTAWTYSNYGGISFYAPAENVESASTMTPTTFPTDHEWPRSEVEGSPWLGCRAFDQSGNQYSINCESGTSFAAPHVAGAIARYLQRHPGASRDQIVSALQSMNSAHSGVQVAMPGSGSAPLLNFIECP